MMEAVGSVPSTAIVFPNSLRRRNESGIRNVSYELMRNFVLGISARDAVFFRVVGDIGGYMS